MSNRTNFADSSRSELQDRLQDRVALFELADRLGVPHRGFRFFSAGPDGAAELFRFLDQGRGQAIESPWWVSSQDAREGLDRWCPPRELQQRDRESWRLAERVLGGLVLETAIEGARRILLPWRWHGEGGTFEFGRAWDVSLSEGMGPFGPVLRRLHLATSPPPSLESDALEEMKARSVQLLKALAARGEGSFEFFVDGVRVFLAGGNAGTAWGMEAGSESSEVEVLGWVHPMDAASGLPQPGVLRVLEGGDTVRTPPECRPGNWIAKGPLLVLAGRGACLEEAVGQLLEELHQVRVQGGMQSSASYLRELCASPWIREGLFHFRYLEEEFVPRGRELSEEELQAVLGLLRHEEPNLTGESVVIDGRLRRVGMVDESAPGDGWVEKLGSGVWMVSIDDISRVVRLREPGARRELRALSAGTVLDIQQGVLEWNGGVVLALESMGAWIPHGVSSALAPALQWLVTPGQCVHRGQVLARLP